MIRNIRALFLAGGTALALACFAGCKSNEAAQTSGGNEEKQVRETFDSFQKALKSKDADKIWALIDKDSQADAEREAKGVREAFAKLDDTAKKAQEKELGLTGAELAALKGPGFLKTRRFLGKYDEVPGSKTDKIEVKGDKAVVNYVETDGDKEKFSLVREEGKWKLTVPMPKGTKP
jgi:hypothetical protein